MLLPEMGTFAGVWHVHACTPPACPPCLFCVHRSPSLPYLCVKIKIFVRMLQVQCERMSSAGYGESIMGFAVVGYTMCGTIYHGGLQAVSFLSRRPSNESAHRILLVSNFEVQLPRIDFLITSAVFMDEC